MAQLPQTRKVIHQLIEAGFSRREFSVQSPPSLIIGGIRNQNGIPLVEFAPDTEAKQMRLAPQIATVLHVKIAHSGGELTYIQVKPYEAPGLFLWIADKQLPVESMEMAYQLAQWEHEQWCRKEEEHQASCWHLERRRFNYQDYMEP